MRSMLLVFVALTVLSAALLLGRSPAAASGLEAHGVTAAPSAGFVLVGDVDCNGDVTSIDALLVLQFDAALLPSLPCPDDADVYPDGQIDSVDAWYILRIDAGLCCLWLDQGESPG